MKKLDLTDEERKQHLSELNKKRLQKYYATHSGRYLSVRLDRWTYDLLTANLKKDGITQKQFIEDAISAYIEKKKSER